jgi:transcriptional regulator with XRE-family HTH domain
MNVIANCFEAVGQIPLLQTSTSTTGPGGATVAGANAGSAARRPTDSPAADVPLHRLGEVREQEGLTRERVAQFLGISIDEVAQKEQPSSDILLSELHRWQKVLRVPIAELLNEPDGEYSPPVQLRARLILAMKTVRSIQESAREESLQWLAELLVNQLVEVMPELKGIAAWPADAPSRGKRELGQAFLRGLSLRCLDELDRLEG